MRKCVVIYLVLAVLAAVSTSLVAPAQDPSGAGADATKVRPLVIVEGSEPAKVQIGDVVRVVGTIPSGMGVVSATTQGPVKLVATNHVRRVVNGKTMIGVMTTEFEVLAQGAGSAKVVVTIENKIRNSTEKKEFNVDIRS
jgi:hypothetical protein